MSLPKDWVSKRLGDIIKDIGDGGTPDTNKKENFGGSILWVVIQDIKKEIFDTKTKITNLGLNSCSAKLWPSGTIILSTGATIGEVGIAKNPLTTKQGIHGLVCSDEINNTFLYYKLLTLKDYLKTNAQGSTIREVRAPFLKTINIYYPTNKSEQTRIAEILSTVDKAIEQTEALIAKQQRIKKGLMQDLLTKGIDENGNIRSEKTHQFKDSPLGRIPVEWEVDTFDSIIESAVDGPFGSNLKSEHYVDEGVRVVRLQNIGEGFFNNIDKAYVSTLHAKKLKRHKIIAGDLIIASMGDTTHPIARACLYPQFLLPGIVKADCFRVRLKKNIAFNNYACYFLNCDSTREDLNLLSQGVTRDRVNLTKLKQIRIRKPSLLEQERIIILLNSYIALIDKEESFLSKLKSIKTGLMKDLLSGERRVTEMLSLR